MAVDMFLKVGQIKGEARDKVHKDEFDVLSWNWGVSNSGSAQQGSGMGAGKVNVQDLTFTKYIDKSTPDLMLACCNGKHFPEAKLIVRKAGEEALEYLKITMTDVLIANVSTGGSQGEERLTENVTLNFAKVKVEYQPQGKDGKKDGGPVEMGWDISKNVKA